MTMLFSGVAKQTNIQIKCIFSDIYSTLVSKSVVNQCPERPLMVRWIVRLIPHGGPGERDVAPW